MLVKPGLSELMMLDDSLCLIIVVSEGLLILSGSTMLVMQRLRIVCSGAEMTMQLVSLSRNIDFGGMDMFHELLFADSGSGWERQRGGQCMTWCDRKQYRTGFRRPFMTPCLGS